MSGTGRLPVATNGRFVDAKSERALPERRAALEKPGRQVWVGTCRPPLVEADAGRAPKLSQGPVARAIGNVRQRPMYRGRTPGWTNTEAGRFS